MSKRKAMQAQPEQQAEPAQTAQVARVRIDPARLYDWQRKGVFPFQGYLLTCEWQDVPLEVAREWQNIPTVYPLEIDVPDNSGV